MSFGFFKKIVIADRISVAVNTVYGSPELFGGPGLVVATFFFAFQIYCDFSGYSDIAIGCAKILDIDLMRNFTQPYLSSGSAEFWRRWHISLSGWLKDYLYIPLGGSRVSKPRYYLNTFVTFFVSGLWHGANWTFVLWGVIHGAYRVVGDMAGSLFKKAVGFKLPKPFRIIFTFLLVCFAWIFFRANSIYDALYIVKNIFSDGSSWLDPQQFLGMLNSLGMPLFEVFISFALVFFLIITDILGGSENIHEFMAKRRAPVGFAFYFIVTAAIISLGVFYNAGEFIYFQF